jgi:hypothetical protein
MILPEDALVGMDQDQSFHIKPLRELGQLLTNCVVEMGRGNRRTPPVRIEQAELIYGEGEAQDHKSTEYWMSIEVIEGLNIVLRLAVISVEL